MTARLEALCIEAVDPARLAAFWAAALRWDVRPRDADVALVPTDGTRFHLRFQPVPHAAATAEVGKNRIHLDLTTASRQDQIDSVVALVDLGAAHVDVGQRGDEGHVVLADPEGNEFCLIEPDNSFLAGCGRLGSITCDGSPQVGTFWSRALGWPLVWDEDDETAIRAPDQSGPFITWGPPVLPKERRNRLRLEIVPTGGEHGREVRRLEALGATSTADHQGPADGTAMEDPDGNEFVVVRRQ